MKLIKKYIKKYIKKDSNLYLFYIWLRDRWLAVNWLLKGRPISPPHFIKQRVVQTYARTYSLATLIETGTYLGDMVFAMRTHFKRIISIEIDNDLYSLSSARFHSRFYEHVRMIHGDSSVVLPELISELQEPCLFWLDGHFSGEGTSCGQTKTPILDELYTILTHPFSHVILIDDAHEFSGEGDYPSLDNLFAVVTRLFPTRKMTVIDNIIRILPRRDSTYSLGGKSVTPVLEVEKIHRDHWLRGFLR